MYSLTAFLISLSSALAVSQVALFKFELSSTLAEPVGYLAAASFDSRIPSQDHCKLRCKCYCARGRDVASRHLLILPATLSPCALA